MNEKINEVLLWLEPIERAGDLDQAQQYALLFARALKSMPNLVKAAEKFVNKCETGRAYSKESYREFKEALRDLKGEG